ncbi:MAG: hypothetical protein F6J90_39630 [Moorea sp. SIOASIH]|nr:hypothetical protein [Moorena sp. SIOASIH]NEO42109.1 hypothetical protein [Moorena sp. SIOASIH]
MPLASCLPRSAIDCLPFGKIVGTPPWRKLVELVFRAIAIVHRLNP